MFGRQKLISCSRAHLLESWGHLTLINVSICQLITFPSINRTTLADTQYIATRSDNALEEKWHLMQWPSSMTWKRTKATLLGDKWNALPFSYTYFNFVGKYPFLISSFSFFLWFSFEPLVLKRNDKKLDITEIWKLQLQRLSQILIINS